MNASFDPLHLVNTYGAFGSITRERYRDRARGHRRRRRVTDAQHVAGVRVQGQARRSGAAAAAGGAVSPAARLADVVRGDGAVAAKRLVLQPARQAAAGRSRHAQPAADESVSRMRRRATCARSTIAIASRRPRSAAYRPLVESAARRHVLRAGVARQRMTLPLARNVRRRVQVLKRRARCAR